MVDHDQERTLHALQRQRENAKHDKAEVTDGAVGNQFLEVRLHHRHQRPVNDSNDSEDEDDHPDRRIHRRPGKERQCKSQEAERPHLQHDAGKNY